MHVPTTLTTKGQVTIPKAVRDFLGLKAGSKVTFSRTKDGRVEIVPEHGAAAVSRFGALRGHARTELSTNEIMALTRGDG
ncbi:AbrB/MazE/SpoVT family DNA-binding domain-containing protein [Roseobacter sp. A03A-229]